MPPRKRAAAAPQDGPATGAPEETPTPQADSAAGELGPDEGGSTTPDADTGPGDEEQHGDSKPPEPSDVPCPTHFPNGWPDGATAVGCEDGTWVRQPS